VYSGKWDFETDRVEVDPNGTYSAAEPVMTLYAAWAPVFEVEFYDLTSGEYLESFTFNPSEVTEILVPKWDEETGAVEMYKFPQRKGYTFNGAYYDAEGTKAVDTAALIHTGSVDAATGTVQNPVMQLYVDWMEGEWYHIYNVEQFLDNASVSGSYIIHADLDFTDEIWPSSLMHGMLANNFTCGVYKMAEGADAAAFADAMKAAIGSAQWICGMPEKLIVAVIDGNYVLVAFGINDAISPFETAITTAYAEAEIKYSEAITG